MDPSFFNILYSQFVFIANGTSIVEEDGGMGLIAQDLSRKVESEIGDAKWMFGKDNVKQKVYKDLNVTESQLGPQDSLITGDFA